MFMYISLLLHANNVYIKHLTKEKNRIFNRNTNIIIYSMKYLHLACVLVLIE